MVVSLYRNTDLLNISSVFIILPSTRHLITCKEVEEILKQEGFYRNKGVLFDKDHNPVESSLFLQTATTLKGFR